MTSGMVLDKTIELKLLSKDKYGRAISKVQAPTGPQQLSDVSLELLQRGYATMYTGKNAIYDDNKEFMECLQNEAKEKKIGMWSLGDALISPADFKRRQEQMSSVQ